MRFGLSAILVSVGALASIAAVLAAVFTPLTVRFHVEGRIDPHAVWAAAIGLMLGPFSLTMLAATKVPPEARLFVFKRQLLRRTLAELMNATPHRVAVKHHKPKVRKKQPPRKPKTILEELEEPFDIIARWVDPEAIVLFFLGETRRVQLRALTARVAFSFEDVALTGQLTGGLYALSAMLPEHVTIVPEPGWDAENEARIVADGSIRFYVGRVATDFLLFALREVHLLPPRAASEVQSNLQKG